MASIKHFFQTSLTFISKLVPLILFLLLAHKLFDPVTISQEQITIDNVTQTNDYHNDTCPAVSVFRPKGSVIHYSNSTAQAKGELGLPALTWIAKVLIYFILALSVPTLVAAAPTYTTDELNKLRLYHVMNTVAQRVLLKAYQYLKEKHFDDSITIKEHLLSIPVGWTQEQYEKEFDPNMRRLIETTDASGEHYDISLLIRSIKTLSLQHEPKNYNKRWYNERQLEHRCQKLATKRNMIFHSFCGISCNDLTIEMDEMKSLLTNILLSLGNRFPAYKSDISDLEKEVLDDLSYFLTHQLDQSQINIASQFVKKDLNPEISQYKMNMCRKFGKIKILDFMSLSSHFHDIKTIFTEVVIKHSRTKVECKDILDSLILPPLSPPTILLLESVAGGGKSTLCIGTMNDWGSGNNTMKTSRYSLLIPMLFRDPVTRSLEDLINKLFPKSKDDIINSFSDPNCNILFICDGYDESNDKSIGVLNEILDLKRYHENIDILITSRPEAVRKFYSNRGRDLNIEHLLIEGVHYNKRCEFLEKYFKDMTAAKGITDSPDELIQFYTGLSDRIKELYKLPMNLATLAWVWIEDKSKARAIKSSTALYASVLEISHQKLLDRLCHSFPDVMKNVNGDLTKLDKLINKFKEVLYNESLLALRNDYVYINEESADKLREICEEIQVPFLELSATYLLSKLEWMIDLRETLEFPHKGIMELYAARAIELLLSKRGQIKSIKQILLELYDDESDFKITKYDNILRLLGGILAMDNPSLLDKHGPEIIQLLAEIHREESGSSGNSRWLEIYSDFNVSTTAAQKFALLIKPHLKLRGFGIKNSYLEILTTLFKYIDVVDVKFQIRGSETPIHLPTVVNMLRHKGCPMVIDKITDEQLDLWTAIIQPDDQIKISDVKLTKEYTSLPLLSRYIVTGEVELQHPWRELKYMPSDVTHHMQHWPVEHLSTCVADINVLPPTVRSLCLSISRDAAGRAVDPGLQQIPATLPQLEGLGVHLAAGTDVQHLKSLPDLVDKDGDPGTGLFLSHVTDTTLSWAIETAVKLQPKSGYYSLVFPRAGVSTGGQLGSALKTMASAGVVVRMAVLASGPHSPRDKQDLRTAAEAAFPDLHRGGDVKWLDNDDELSKYSPW